MINNLQLFPIEIQYEDSDLIEISYRKEFIPEYLKAILSNILQEQFKYSNIEMVSFYNEHIVLVYKGYISYNSDLLDYYAYKVNLKNYFYHLKTYSKNIFKYKHPKLPEGSVIASQFGLGEYYTDDLINTKDIYFFHSNPPLVCKYFNCLKLNNIEPQENCLALFGITFNCKTLDVIKIKRYIYPFDLYIKNPSYL
jgi:hypothetical protein